MKINQKLKRALDKSIAGEKFSILADKNIQRDGGRAQHLVFGDAGEDLAARFLIGQGYKIIGRNVRVGHFELDIVARDREELVFAEVRTRRENPVAAPEDTVGRDKLQKLIRAASLYTQKINYGGFWRIDLIAVTSCKNGELKLEHIKDITEPII